MEEYLLFAKRIALQAGVIMLKNFNPNVEQWIKKDNSIVTLADTTINQMVIDEVNKTYPNTTVLGEEQDNFNNSKLAWVCDPVDGTVNYAKCIPINVFSLALVDDGEPVLGVVYEPYTKKMYTAIKGKGAYLNDEPIKVSNSIMGIGATFDLEWWPEAEFDTNTPLHKLSLDTGTYVLHIGSTIYGTMLVASGRFEACVFSGTKGKYVDIAAAKVIVEEAGGKVTDLFGNEQRYDKDIKGAVVSNGIIHKELIERLHF